MFPPDWIRLVFAHPFPLDSRAPIASANIIAHGKVQVSPLMMEPAQLMGAPLFKTKGWAQSSPYPVSPFHHSVNHRDKTFILRTTTMIMTLQIALITQYTNKTTTTSPTKTTTGGQSGADDHQ